MIFIVLLTHVACSWMQERRLTIIYRALVEFKKREIYRRRAKQKQYSLVLRNERYNKISHSNRQKENIKLKFVN